MGGDRDLGNGGYGGFLLSLVCTGSDADFIWRNKVLPYCAPSSSFSLSLSLSLSERCLMQSRMTSIYIADDDLELANPPSTSQTLGL